MRACTLPVARARTHTRIRFPSTILGAESRVNTVSVHALQPQLFLIHQPASACQGSTWGEEGGGVAQARATTSHLRPEGARVIPDPNRASTRWMQMLVQLAAGLRPVSTEPFTVSRIRPYRRLAANALALICTRVSRNVRGSRCCSVASHADRSSSLPGFGLVCVDAAAAVPSTAVPHRRQSDSNHAGSAPPAGVESTPPPPPVEPGCRPHSAAPLLAISGGRLSSTPAWPPSSPDSPCLAN